MDRPEGPTPLTERILARVPGPRWVWAVLWLLVPWANAGVWWLLQRGGRLPGWEDPVIELLGRAALGLAILLSIWGAGRIAAGLRDLRPRLAELTGADDPLAHFRGVGATAGPILLTLASAAIFGAEAVVEHDSWLRAAVTAVSWLIVGLPLWTFFCVYLSLQVGFDRVGRRPLALDRSLADRSLGLRPLGDLAFTAFSTLILVVGPLLVVSAGNALALGVGVAVTAAALGAFFLTLGRLHGQLAAAKREELGRVRDLYAGVVLPVREDAAPPEALERRSALVGAADALLQRAERIQEWPFDESTLARVVAISSGVATAIVTRALLAPFGA